MPRNALFYGDNLEIMQEKKEFSDESVDLCYIDPPFNSKRTYNQIYNNEGKDDRAQARAFIDTWVWDEEATNGLSRIQSNYRGRYTEQCIDLINGLEHVLKRGSLFAYIVSMTQRIAEIHRLLKIKGTFYLHCNPVASHYLKLVCDALFIPRGGQMRNEIIWCYRGGGVPRHDFARKHQTIFRYSKSKDVMFDVEPVRIPYSEDVTNSNPSRYDKSYRENKVYEGYKPNPKGKHPEDWWPIQPLMPSDKKERIGYPTQKPKKLLERIILSSSKPGDVILDAYCGCGTTVAVAQDNGRRWIGIDITFQSIATILNRLEDDFGPKVAAAIFVDGIPKDSESAAALAHRRDDRVRKEFEKWAILTYTNHRAVIRQQPGADGGIDGVVYFVERGGRGKMVLQAKSGHVERKDIAALRGDLAEKKATLACLITLQKPSKPMIAAAKDAGGYTNDLTEDKCDKIRIVTVDDLLDGKRFEMPLDLEAIHRELLETEGQMSFEFGERKPAKRGKKPVRPATGAPILPFKEISASGTD